VPLWQAPETHSYFDTLFRVPDSHTFSRNAASGNMIAQNALQSAAEFERFLRGDQPPLGGPSGRQIFRAASRPSRCESVNFVNSPIRSGTIGIDGVDERGVRFHPGNIGLCVTCVPKSNQIAIGRVAKVLHAVRGPVFGVWQVPGPAYATYALQCESASHPSRTSVNY